MHDRNTKALLPFILRTAAKTIEWITTNNQKIIQGEKVDYSLYNGLSGNLFFLLELFKTTKKGEYLDVVTNSCNVVIKANPLCKGMDLSFYAGMGGFIYILIEVYKLTDNVNYLNYAIEIAKTGNASRNTVCDLLIGKAGEILTLLHLHNAVDEDWIVDEIDKRVHYILSHAIIVNNGICWDIQPNKIRPLCGFSHGTSGIAFIFIELYRYFNNIYFYWVAKKAFNYENRFFDNKVNNWPDFRQDIYSEIAIEKILWNLDVKSNSQNIHNGYLSFWCHGAPGIGMAHLHAYNVSGNIEHNNICDISISNVLSTMDTISDYSLCHGLCGNGNLLIDAYISNKDDYLYKRAQEISVMFFKCDRKRIYMPSLFLGSTGIAYFFLRLLYFKETFSILKPNLVTTKSHTKLHKYTTGYFISIFAKTCYPNTTKSLDYFEYKYIENISIEENIYLCISKEEDITSGTHYDYLLDLNRNKVLHKVDNYCHMYAAEYRNKKKYAYELNANQNIILNKYVDLMKVNSTELTRFFLFEAIYTFPGIKQSEIDQLIYLTLSIFENPNTIHGALEELLSTCVQIDKLYFKKECENIVGECLRKNWLVII